MKTGWSLRARLASPFLLGAVAVAVAGGMSAAHDAHAVAPKSKKKSTTKRSAQQGARKAVPRGATSNASSPVSASLVCRGPFQLNAGPRMRILGRKAPGPGGTFGRQLEPGECALPGRPLGGAEYAEIMLPFSEWSVAAAAAASSVLAACALDSECVLRIRVTSDRGAWTVDPRSELAIARR